MLHLVYQRSATRSNLVVAVLFTLLANTLSGDVQADQLKLVGSDAATNSTIVIRGVDGEARSQSTDTAPAVEADVLLASNQPVEVINELGSVPSVTVPSVSSAVSAVNVNDAAWSKIEHDLVVPSRPGVVKPGVVKSEVKDASISLLESLQVGIPTVEESLPIPGEDELSLRILEATAQGIDAKDFAITPFSATIKEESKDQPLTIDQAVQMGSDSGAAVDSDNPLRAANDSSDAADKVESDTPDVEEAVAKPKLGLNLKRPMQDITPVPDPVSIDVLPPVGNRRTSVASSKTTTATPDAEKIVGVPQGLPKQITASDGPEPTTAATQVPPSSPISEGVPPAKPVTSIPPVQYQIPQEPNVVITRQMASLQPRIAKSLRFYYNRPLNTRDDSAWSIMHSVLGYGQNAPVAINSKKGRRTNAVNWMCSNNPCANRRLLYLDRGYIRGIEGPGSQGHPAQFLAMLAQIDLRRDYPVRVQGYTFKVEDMVNSEMFTCDAQRELTFKLISLSHYLHSDAKWKNETGEVWSIPRMLEIELAQPVNGAACGGTHRVMSIAYALRTKERRGEPVEGVYLRARQYVRDYQRYTMSMQNRDGSFSSDWFKRRSSWGDKDRQLQTTGHLLEWMVYSLPRNELSDPRIVRSVEFLTNLMTRHRYHEWEVGPRGHALRALALYHKRVFEPQPTSMPVARLGSMPAEIDKLVR